MRPSISKEKDGEMMTQDGQLKFGFALKILLTKRPPAGVVWKFGEGVQAQVSSSSSDCGSNVRVPSQNSPLVASKRYDNITELN
ncbi:hypothetical protein AVEN_165073-1 [Araneus ventricosus]|uniref:Uncharacterized protein n=1 Tax=Araneus ventricosus TaxID=182803 RepID=A0A4Y2F8L4_ARAVE|nr:hypothetical protein AVEN_165073-1 [Araneus ventricosus]